jgi:hypothetical protein
METFNTATAFILGRFYESFPRRITLDFARLLAGR